MKHWTLACLMGLALLSACSSKSDQDANAQNGAGGSSGYGAGGPGGVGGAGGAGRAAPGTEEDCDTRVIEQARPHGRQIHQQIDPDSLHGSARTDTRARRISALAPYCARPEAQLHVKYSFLRAALASLRRHGRSSTPVSRDRRPKKNGLPTIIRSIAESKLARLHQTH